MKNKSGSFLMLMLLIVSLCSISVMGEWSSQLKNGQRSATQTDSNIDLDTIQYANFTCGTDDSTLHYWEPILIDVTGNGEEDMIVSCAPDSVIGSPHILVVDDDFNQRENEIITTTLPSGLENDFLPMTVADLNDDGEIEVIIVNLEDYTLPGDLSFIAYTYNSSTNSFSSYAEQIVLSSSSIVELSNGTNVTLLNDFANNINRITFECFDGSESIVGGYCIYIDNYNLIYTDITDSNPDYAHNMFGSVNTYIPGFRRPGAAEYWIINSSAHINYYDLLNLDHDPANSYLLQDIVAGTIDHAAIIQCDDTNSSDCSSGYELIVTHDGGDIETIMYQLVGGSILEKISSGGTSDVGFGWIEDRDSDGVTELCSASLKTSGEGSYKCENLNFFGFDSNYGDIKIDAVHDAWRSLRMHVIDLNNDGDYELVNGKTAGYIVNSLGADDMEITYIFNETGFPAETMTTISSDWDAVENGSASMISWPVAAGSDIYYVASPGIPTAVEIIPNLVQFDDRYFPIQQISNPVCNTEENLGFKCTYANGCLSTADGEIDDYNMYVDCFNDGVQTASYTYSELEATNFIVYCDVTSINNTGTQAFFLQVWESGYQEFNDTFLGAYTVTNSTTCYNSSNPGNITEPSINLPPEFVGDIVSFVPTPYCSGAEINFTCDVGTCYEDNDGDKVYLRADCDNDGTYETISSLGYNVSVACSFTNTSQTSISVRVYDQTHTTLIPDDATQSYSIEVSSSTEQDNIDTGTLLCFSSRFYSTTQTDTSGFDAVIGSFAGNSLYLRLILGLTMVLLITGAVVGGFSKKGVKGQALVVIGAVSFVISVILATAIGLLPAYILILALVIGILMLAYNKMMHHGGD